MATLELLRERTVRALASHYAADHLHAGTLEHRLEGALAARTPDDLSAVTWDLPVLRRSSRQQFSSLFQRGAESRCTRIVFEVKPRITLDLTREACRTWLVGRSEGCDIAVGHIAVSRRHALVSNRGGQCSIRDLASMNGLEINGQKVRTAVLRPGDVLVFGGSVVAVVR